MHALRRDRERNTAGIAFTASAQHSVAARRPRLGVGRRERERQAGEPRWRLIWAMCGASWVAGAATAPYVWRGLEWFGHRAGLPDLVWKMGFGVWWSSE